MTEHPDFEAEQAHINRTYDRLEESRRAALKLKKMVEVGRGGTEQARFEREAIYGNVSTRLAQLDFGDANLCFGRLDRDRVASAEAGDGYDTVYVGRVAVSDSDHDPLLVDWRAPAAEAFYRATGRSPMGLRRRRHFATRGRTLLGLDDEYFGDEANRVGVDGTMADLANPDTPAVQGQQALFASLEAGRTGSLSDIVATIQGEQDEIIRAPMPGVMVVQGGPGTGKTVVALHRAAYLLYTHRFPLEGQGVLVIGPNRLFLGYIERVLPSLGEAGVELAVLADLVDHVEVVGRDRGEPARLKGDLAMVKMIRQAVRDRERSLRADLAVGYGLQTLRFTVEQSAALIADTRRRFRTHNAGRRHVEAELFRSLAESGREPLDPEEVRGRLRTELPVREALEWMWPVLTPAQLLHDLMGATSLLRSATRSMPGAPWEHLHRPRSTHADEVVWTTDDVPLLDEARAHLGARPGKKDADAVRTYGHIVVDEAQDLSPMQLRMLRRRSLNGSMTVVGDIAQSTGAWAHNDWSEVLDHLPDRREARRVELTVGYRIPGALMGPANAVLAEAAPQLVAPKPVREGEGRPVFVTVAAGESVAAVVAQRVNQELVEVSGGAIAVISPRSMLDDLDEALGAAGVEFGRANRSGLRQRVTLVAVDVVKGLELDSAIVVEPTAIVEEEPQGMRSLYVALTRSTQRLTLVHGRTLPPVLLGL